MRWMRGPWRLALVGGLELLLIAGIVGGLRRTASHTDDDGAALRALAVRFYERQSRRDIDGFTALWAPAAPTLPAQRTRLRIRLAFYDLIEVGDVAVASMRPGPDGVVLDVEVDLQAREPTGELAAGFGRLHRVIECVKTDGRWTVRREYAAEERLADAVVQADSDDARAALVTATAGTSHFELFRALANRAAERQAGGEAARGLEILRQAFTLSVRLGEPMHGARMLASLGQHHDRAGDLGMAMDYYRQALTSPGAADDAEGRAETLSLVGAIHMRRGDYGQALKALEDSLALRDGIGHQAVTSPTVRNIGSVYLLQGDFDRAVIHYRRALALADAVDDAPLAASTLINLGAVEHERGRYQSALAYYGRVIGLGELPEARGPFRIALNNIGLVHRLQGRLDLARDYLTRSRQRAELAGDKDLLGSALLNLGMVERLQGNVGAALDLYERSLALRESAGQKAGAALALNSIGLLHQNEGRHNRALEYYRRSLALSEQLNGQARIAQTLVNIATVHNDRGEHASALVAARRGVEVARRIGQEGEVLWSGLAATARALHGLRQAAPAREAYEAAIAALEQMRSEAGGTLQEQQAFLERRLVAHEGLTQLLVSEGDLGGALATAERAKARVLLDVIRQGPAAVSKAMTADERTAEERLRAQLAALNADRQRERGRSAGDAPRLAVLDAGLQRARLDYAAFQTTLYATHPELRVRRGELPAFDIAQADGLLPDVSTSAIEFVVAKDQTLRFVLTRAVTATAAEARGGAVTLSVHHIPVTRVELTALVTDLRARLATRDLGVREPAMRLFQLLFAPAIDVLQRTSAIVIVPDGVLWELPFQALQPTPDRYLVESHAISYVSSLAVLREVRHPGRSIDSAARFPLLALGNPALNAAASSPEPPAPAALAPLPDAERQVHLLSRLYGRGSRAYIGEAAREQIVKAEAPSSRILHLATHGVLDDQSPMHSHLVLSQAPPRGDEDGLLEAWELMELDLQADLVVLSACETGRGRIGPGEGVIGMSWAAFVAGSPATVASLWKVESQSTTELMLAFHRGLLAAPATADATPSKAHALQRAALTLLHDERYRHPFYWAGFVLVGDTTPLERRIASSVAAPTPR